MREREKQFIEYFLEELQGDDVEGAADRASKRMTWTAGGYELLKDKTRMRRARNILAKPGSVAMIQQFFEAATGFTPMQAAAKLVDHIEGNFWVENQVQNAKGEIINLTHRIPPSLAALKTYIDLSIPKQATKINIDSKHEVRGIIVGDEPPRTRVRVLENGGSDIDSPVKELPK